MSIKYYTGIVIMLLMSLWACNDEDEDVNMSGFRPQHSMRVKKITGYNDIWKDYSLEVSYVNNKVADIERFSKSGRKVGGLSIDREQGEITYDLMDYVPAIDADSISRLDEHLKNVYGAENYSLEDSIPLLGTRLLSVNLVTIDGIIKSQQFTYYQHKTEFGLGAEFDPYYTIKQREIFVYEYNSDGQILVSRKLIDVFDSENTQIYEREGYKVEYEFVGSKVAKRSFFMVGADYEGNWKLLHDYSYLYDGKFLKSISGDGYVLKRNYVDGKLVSIDDNGMLTHYTMNDQGYCVKIEDSKGNIMNIEYEAGSGDFEIFTPLEKNQQGFPVIW